MKTDKYGRKYDLLNSERCKVCGQPDLDGNCNHQKIPAEDVEKFGGRLPDIEIYGPLRYLCVISSGPFIFVRIPTVGLNWKSDVLKGLTVVMQEHGMRQKDITCIEGYARNYKYDLPLVLRLDRAYTGDTTCVPKFYLYDWIDGKFNLVRKPVIPETNPAGTV